jgi:hypothetical protein
MALEQTYIAPCAMQETGVGNSREIARPGLMGQARATGEEEHRPPSP